MVKIVKTVTYLMLMLMKMSMIWIWPEKCSTSQGLLLTNIQLIQWRKWIFFAPLLKFPWREDIESSLSDYKTSLSILERLVEPDSRHIAELHFRVCICLETGCQPKEEIPYLLMVLISRYPTFIGALRNLDDCLTMVHLFRCYLLQTGKTLMLNESTTVEGSKRVSALESSCFRWDGVLGRRRCTF